MHVGEIIHNLRKERRMILSELSDKSGVALATLSRIENKKMTGTLKSHIKICEALEISLPELYKYITLSKKQVEFRTKDAQSGVSVHKKNFSSEILMSKTANKKMMPLLVKISKRGTTDKDETKPGVEKFIYVLDGKIEADIGEEKYNLTKGDTLYYESSVPHRFKNTGPGESRLICVISPPNL